MDKTEYDLQKKLIDYSDNLKKERNDQEYNQKMETLKYIRDTERLKHELEMERMRIKSAEIRKAQWRTHNKK